MNWRPTKNKVLISIERQFQEKIGSLYIDLRFNPEEKVSLLGMVEALPMKIDPAPGQVLDLRGLCVGDVVMLRYDVLSESREQPDRDTVRYQNEILIDDQRYWIADAEQILARKGVMKWYPLNDYEILYPVKIAQAEKVGSIWVPDSAKSDVEMGVGRTQEGGFVRFHPKMAMHYTLDNQEILIIRERYIQADVHERNLA